MTPPPNTPSKADTFLVSCIDPRLTDDTTFLQAALGRTDRYSEMRIAGAALAAVDSNRPAWGTALWENLAASRALHGIRQVTFLNHRDCGAMHLWAGRRLADDPAEEARVHADVLNRAAAEVRARHPDLLVEIKLMELDGSTRILPCAACVPRGFRAEAVEPATAAIAIASLGAGATLAPPLDAEPPPNPAGFADLARVRLGDGRASAPEAELALLTEGVTRYGLTAREAKQVRESVAAPAHHGTRDVQAFLQVRRDAQGRIGPGAVKEAAGLYRRLAGARVTAPEAERRAAEIALADGLAPQPKGIWPFRSTHWFDRLTAGG